MRSEGGESLFTVDLVLGLSGLSPGKVHLYPGGESLLDVDNELRLASLGLQLLNQSSLVEDGEGLLQPGPDLTGNGLFLASRPDHIVVLQLFQDLVVGDKSGALQLEPAGGVVLGLDADLSGEPDTRVLVVQLRDARENVGRVFIPILLQLEALKPFVKKCYNRIELLYQNYLMKFKTT